VVNKDKEPTSNGAQTEFRVIELVAIIEEENLERLMFAYDLEIGKFLPQNLKHILGALFCQEVSRGLGEMVIDIPYRLFDL
jgi:hypothetical protein